MSNEIQPSALHDLEVLRRSEPEQVSQARRPWAQRLVVILLVLGGLAAAFAVLRPVFFPPRTVTFISVRAGAPGTVRRTASSVQAAAWIEADPFPSTVRPLVRGVIERLDVVEGSPVKKGETIIAVLRNVELENRAVLAAADLRLSEAESALAKTALNVAESLLAQKLALHAEEAERAGELAAMHAQVDRARARRKVAEAVLERERVDLRAQEELKQAGHGTPTALLAAAAAVREAAERVSETHHEEARFAAEAARASALLKLAREGVKDPRALQGAVDLARSTYARAVSTLARVRLASEIATHDVGRLTVYAPADGVVMRLESAPGALVGPVGEFKGEREGTGSSGGLNRLTGTICSIYDPKHLQARVDLSYADVADLVPGTSVEIEAKALPGRQFAGVVDRLVREADITQAKLQVKVRLIDPDALLRPEMLCTARFLVKAPTEQEGAAASSTAGPVEVPTAALHGEAVFVYDPTGGGRARRVPVRIVRRGPDWTEVEGSLGLSSKLILESVEDGESVKGPR